MSDATQPDAIEPLLNATIGAPRLSGAQRQRHLARLSLTPSGAPSEAMRPALAGTILDDASMRPAAYREHSRRSRRGWAELAVVAAIAVLLVGGAIVVRDRTSDDGGERGVPAELIMAAAGELAPGEGLHAVVNIESDYREDDSLLREWSVESWRRVLSNGTKQEHFVMRNPAGEVFMTYAINGDDWSVNESGWVENGALGEGFRTISPQLGWSMSEPAGAARFLDEQANSDQVEIVYEERGEVYRLRSTGGESFEEESRRFGLTINGSVYEIVRDPETGNVLETRAYFTSEEGIDVTFMRATLTLVEVLPAEQMDDALFEITVEDVFPQYAAPEQLPGGLTLDSHIDDFLAGSERLVYIGTGMELIVSVSPPAGGYDPSGLIAVSRPGTVRSVDSAVGPVTWGGQEESSSPRFAYWDDGRNRFRLSVAGTAPVGWDVAALIAVVEALSSVATDT